MIRKIVKLGDETLRKISKPMPKFDLRLWLLLRDMAETMYDAEGVGLAGPQVGILRRVVVIDVGTLRVPYEEKRALPPSQRRAHVVKADNRSRLRSVARHAFSIPFGHIIP